MILRFAPSPTGSIHIGNLRTAIFNWLYARKNGGKFILRIEDTDIARNNKEAVDLIINSMKWLNLDYDEMIIQSENINRHNILIEELIQKKKAYKCFCSKERIEQLRENARQNKQSRVYDGYCKDKQEQIGEYVVRIALDRSQSIFFEDGVFGLMKKNNDDIDDFIIQRSNKMPIYLFSVVVDDHDENVTHIIRGADHIPNTFAQIEIYNALNWSVPKFIHVPLINSEDGNKLSKRKNAVSLSEYQKMGIMPEAIFNGLLRLGWAYKDYEVINMQQALEIFDISGIRRSPARFDIDKILNLNSIYINQMENEEIFNRLYHFSMQDNELLKAKDRVIQGMNGLKSRCKTLKQIYEMSKIYFYNFKTAECNISSEEKKILADFIQSITNYDNIESEIRSFCLEKDIKLSEIAKILRLILTNSNISPSIFEIMKILKEESINRIRNYINMEYK